jgi:hypothetical protein
MQRLNDEDDEAKDLLTLRAYPLPREIQGHDWKTGLEPDKVLVPCPWCRGVHVHQYGAGVQASRCGHPEAPSHYLLSCSKKLTSSVRELLAYRLSANGFETTERIPRKSMLRSDLLTWLKRC